MPSRSELVDNSRLILGCGMLTLGSVWLLRLLWPLLLLLILAGLGAGGYWLLQRQQQAFLQQQRREDRLARKFYELLDYRQGRISSLEFAMHTRIDGREAQRYLYTQAQAFGGFFERTAHNDVVYIFNPAVIYSYASQQPATPAEVAWNYAEQARAEQLQQIQAQQLQADQAKHSQTAWANARQLRAIQQLAHSSSAPTPKGLPASAEDTLPTVRGKAYGAASIKTIDVTAVNE